MAKKKPIVRRRHQFLVRFASKLIAPKIIKKKGYNLEKIDLKQYEPFFLVSNHVVSVDPIFVTATLGTQIYYVSTELIFSQGLVSRALEYAFAPLPKERGKIDITVVKAMMQVAKEGGNIGVFVEGNVTMQGLTNNVPATIGKLVLSLKMPLVIFNLENGYLTNPRWATHIRKQQNFKGRVRQVLTYEEYKHMTPDEINEIIINGITVDNYNKDVKTPFEGEHNAEGIHRLLFTCPHCKAVNKGYATGNTYVCSSCNFTMEYDEYGYLHSDEFDKPKTTIELDAINKNNYQEFIVNNKDYQISAEGLFNDIYRRRRKKFGKARLSLSLNGMAVEFKQKRHKNFTIPFEKLEAMFMQSKDQLVFYTKGEQKRMLDINPSELVSSYQFLITFQILSQIKLCENGEYIPLTLKQLGL